jgi:murein DD-endopeptidase MepM/ murein hydrolase activator NlpD
MHKKARSKYITILFVPDDEGKTHSLRMHSGILRSLIVFVALFVIGIAALLYVAGDIALKLQLVYSLQKENEHLRQENQTLLAITGTVDRIQQMSDYLKRLALVSRGDRPAQSGTSAVTLHTGQSADVFKKDELDKFLDTIRIFKNRQADSIGETPQKALEAIPYMRPVDGWITRSFSTDSQGGKSDHQGIDFAAPLGALIRAPAPGTVASIINDTALGNVVTLIHSKNLMTRYGHCSQILVAAGDKVRRGQTIALIGNTGNSSAPHLHYEVIKDGKSVDPLRYILDAE